ncbi:hypothetical protein BDC45DRAFT_541577 [Circinella umbellata]|nr:hypothetical protein BDC45DRAFT_541577 [Circinella umbellata]
MRGERPGKIGSPALGELDGSLGFQIHGFHVTFYICKSCTLPTVLDFVPFFVTLPNLINDAFWRVCKRSSNPEGIERIYTETLLAFEDVVDPSRDNSHKCLLRFGQ